MSEDQSGNNYALLELSFVIPFAIVICLALLINYILGVVRKRREAALRTRLNSTATTV
jgi:hypothetical protein